MNFLILLSSVFACAHGPAHEHQDKLTEAARIATSLYSGANPVAVEAKVQGAAVQVNILAAQGNSVSASAFACEGRSGIELCNGQRAGSANPAFRQLLESAASLGHGLEEAGAKGAEISYFKVYKRPNGRIWARALFSVNGSAPRNAVLSCHQHGSHFDCHYQNANAQGPDEPFVR